MAKRKRFMNRSQKARRASDANPTRGWFTGEELPGVLRDPEPAFVGKVAHGAGFLGDVAAHAIPFVAPAGGLEVGEDFGAIGQVHECAAQVVLKVAVAELDQQRVLFAGRPLSGFIPPRLAFGGGMLAVVGGEDKRS